MRDNLKEEEIEMKTKILNGIDRIKTAEGLLCGQRLALLTSASGVNKQGIPSSEIISKIAPITVIFAPEHGIKSNLQDGLYGKETRDEETGAVICDASAMRKPDEVEELFSKFDIAVYDIQDVGARFYTYLYNLTDLMICCKKYGKRLLVFDRVNPIGGTLCEGAVLEVPKCFSGIGKYPIPVRYGLTVGEFATYINETENIGCDLSIIKCDGWHRSLYADETDHLWVNPSPNIPSVSCAVNYIGTCIFEATNISEGRGTTRPFDLIGAPFVDENKFYDYMTAQKLDGAVFRKAHFTPGFNKHAGETCHGIEVHITDREQYRPIKTGLHLLYHLKQYSEFTCRYDGLALRHGNDLLNGDFDVDAVYASAEKECAEYIKKSKPYQIYD